MWNSYSSLLEKRGGGEGVVKDQEKVPIAGTFVKPDFDIILPNVIYSV